MNVLQSLKSLSSYPIPTATVEDVAEGVGLKIDSEMSMELRNGKEYKRAKAGVFLFLSEAPNVTQGGISYSFSESERKRFRDRANNILCELGESSDDASLPEFGYKGEDL